MPHTEKVRETSWIKTKPACWTLTGKPFHFMRLSVEPERLEPALMYPSPKTFPEGYASTLSELFSDCVRKKQVEHFPKQRDKYLLCERVDCLSSSICAIYMLKGGVIKEHAVTDYDPNSAWYQTYVAPYFKEEKGKYFTVLEKVVKGAFQFVEEEIACPSQVKIYHAPNAPAAGVRVVVTREDRPYFIMKACGETIAVSTPAKELMALHKRRHKTLELAAA